MANYKTWKNIRVPIIVALIAALGGGGWYTACHSKKDQATISIKQKNESGTNVAAGGNIYQAGSYDIHPTGPVNIYYVDTTKHKFPSPPGSGRTDPSKHIPSTQSGSSGNGSVNVTSINQHGGLTVGQIIVLDRATFIKSDKSSGLGDVVKNFTCTLDKGTQRITIQPKTGEWNNPFIAFPYSEFASVNPHFANINHTQINVDTASYGINGDNLFGLSTLTRSATPSLGYYIHYSQIPTKIVFGNYPAPLYEAVLNQDK